MNRPEAPAPTEPRRKRVDPYADAPRLPDGPLVPSQLLGTGALRVELEIGPGRGWFLFERLEARPDVALIGLEIRRKWATIVDRRLAARGLGGRARVFAEDALHVLPRFAEGSIDVAYVHFPDPWWKKRHQKRLVVGDVFVAEIARVLRPGGELFVQTDVEERALDYEQAVDRDPRLRPIEALARVAENPYQARSPRERRAIDDGLPIVRLRWSRVAP